MRERISFLFCKRVNCFDASQFCGGELSESLLRFDRFDLLFLDNFELFLVRCLFEGERTSCSLRCFGSWLHLNNGVIRL